MTIAAHYSNDHAASHYVSVGVMSGKEISFLLNGAFSSPCGTTTGEQTVKLCEGRVLWNGNTFTEIEFAPHSPEATFTLHDVTIGKKFHWERKEQETFGGTLRIICEGAELTAINRINVEDYLVSVISSEMSATSSLEFLRAQAVVSRSWLMRILEARRNATACKSSRLDCVPAATNAAAASNNVRKNEIIRWYENDAHVNFDVCADDHCQRYEGITRAQSPQVREAVRSTCGEVLTYGGSICDARFSKCCGGITENFSACWDEHDEPYLSPVYDRLGKTLAEDALPNFGDEKCAEEWTTSSPEAFCNTHDKEILSQVLNDYDFETEDFFRWTVSYTQEQLAELISTKLGVDIGRIKSLIPGIRGASGRLITLHINGTKRCLTIGKELEIRRALSPTHLMSSAFTVHTEGMTPDGLPAHFIIYGAGWGHGVGMCQIGAAVMAAKGFGYKEILKHYYKNSEITKLYD